MDETTGRPMPKIISAMRGHPFTPGDDPRYCGHWSGPFTTTTDHGTLMFGSQCGYPPELHPQETVQPKQEEENHG